MTYKPEEIELIKSLRESNVSWKAIGLALKKTPSALKAFWSRYKAIEGLPPKVKLDKSITFGNVLGMFQRVRTWPFSRPRRQPKPAHLS
jgi:hypothetical protein